MTTITFSVSELQGLASQVEGAASATHGVTQHAAGVGMGDVNMYGKILPGVACATTLFAVNRIHQNTLKGLDELVVAFGKATRETADTYRDLEQRCTEASQAILNELGEGPR